MNKLLLLSNKYLHSLVYFIADKPAKDNISPSIPLVGTDSYRTLLNWCAVMDIDVTRIRMYNQVDKPFNGSVTLMTLNRAVELGQIKVIALGNKAADYLSEVGVEEYFVLPHPSPKNRVLNNKPLVKEKLGACKTYVYGTTQKSILSQSKKEQEEKLEEG